MKFVVTREVRIIEEIDITAHGPWDALKTALAAERGEWRPRPGWKRNILEDNLDGLQPDNEVDQAVAVANKTVRCAECDGADFVLSGGHWACAYCGLTD